MPRWFSLVACLALAGAFVPAKAQDSPPRSTCPSPDPGKGLGVVTGIVREAETQVAMGFVDVRLIPGSNDLGGMAYLTRSAPNGRFQFCDVPVGTYTIQGWFDQIGGDLTQVSVGPGGETSLTLNLGLAAESDEPGSLSGKVMDADTGKPVEGATVRLAEPVLPPGTGVGGDEGSFAAEAVNLIHPTNIQAIEIFQGPSSTPGQYLDSRARCGVILIWTRRGPRG